MNRKKATSLIAIILVLLMVISLVASIIPATAYAVSQRDLEQIQQEKAQLSSRVQECQSRIDKLKEEQSMSWSRSWRWTSRTDAPTSSLPWWPKKFPSITA